MEALSIGQMNFFFVSERSLILKDTIQKKPPKNWQKQIETIQPYTIIYILLGIMEPKYVYQVAFRKPGVEYLFHCFFYREEVLQTTVSLLRDEQNGAIVSQQSGEIEMIHC